MSRTDEQFAILAASERLDLSLDQLKKALKELDLSIDEQFSVKFGIAMIDGVASYMRAKSNKIAETQP